MVPARHIFAETSSNRQRQPLADPRCVPDPRSDVGGDSAGPWGISGLCQALGRGNATGSVWTEAVTGK